MLFSFHLAIILQLDLLPLPYSSFDYQSYFSLRAEGMTTFFGEIPFFLFRFLAGGSNAALSSSLFVKSNSDFLLRVVAVVAAVDSFFSGDCHASSSTIDWIVNASSSFPPPPACLVSLFLDGEVSFPVLPNSSSCVASSLCGIIPGLFFLCLHNFFHPCTSNAITCAILSSFSVFSCFSFEFLLTTDGWPSSLVIDTCPCETKNDNVKTFSTNCANDCPLNTASMTGHWEFGNLFNSLTMRCMFFAVVFSWSFFVDSNSSGFANSPRMTFCARWVIFRSLISVFMTPSLCL